MQRLISPGIEGKFMEVVNNIVNAIMGALFGNAIVNFFL